MMTLKKILPIFSLVFVTFLLGNSNLVFAYCPPYFSYIDSIEPNNIDCLKIKTYGACGGSLEITNECPQIFYLEGEKILNDDGYELDHNTTYFYKKVSWPWHGEPVNGEEVEQINWTLNGKLGDKNIIVKGRTVHEEYRTSLIPLFIFLVIIFLIGLLVLKKLKKYDKKKVLFVIIAAVISPFLVNILLSGVLLLRPVWEENNKASQVGSYSKQIDLANKALSSQDEKFCQEISDSLLKAACFAMGKSDINQCKALEDRDMTDWCIKKIAITSQNQSYCNEISDKDSKDFCFTHVAYNKGQPSICQNISETKYRPKLASKDICFERIAYKTNDKLICECIEEDRTYENCNLYIDKVRRGSKQYIRMENKPDICFE
ncbi:MAG: hypothetical protein ACOX5S_00230 [Patescibacteria group bacterium]|jgi:hypothetical protein